MNLHCFFNHSSFSFIDRPTRGFHVPDAMGRDCLPLYFCAVVHQCCLIPLKLNDYILNKFKPMIDTHFEV